MSSDGHTTLIKTPRQLITVVVLAFLAPVILIILLATFVTSDKGGGTGSDAMTPEAIAERLRPIGSVVLASASTGPRSLQSGEAVYKLACSACHATGAAGAPKAGDAAAWSLRIKQGYDTLVKHAVEGFKAMPAKGGNANLDPIEVARAVAYMANQSGAKFKEPEAPAPAATKSAARTGEQIVQMTCGNCHNTGLHGAPKIGDRAAWTKRVSNGVDAVTAAAIKGHGGMPSRGGMADLTDAELKSAVQYMFNRSTATPGVAAAPADDVDMQLRHHVAERGDIDLLRRDRGLQRKTRRYDLAHELRLVVHVEIHDFRQPGAAGHQQQPGIVGVAHQAHR